MSSFNHRNGSSSSLAEESKKKPSLFTRMLSRNSRELSSASSSSSSQHSSHRSRENSLPPLGNIQLTGYKSTTKHKLLDLELAHNIRNLLPPRLQLFDEWQLIYSFEQNGISLNTLYRNCNPEYQLQQLKKKNPERGFGDGVVHSMIVGASTNNPWGIESKRPQGYVLIISDDKKNKFGCYINENLRPTDHKRYYGNGECFLWKVEKFDPSKLSFSSSDQENKHGIRFKAYMYTGINDNIIFSNTNYIAIGSSNGQNGLWIDKSLYAGVSYPCETFGNEILNIQHPDPSIKVGKSKIMNMEIWRIGSLE